MDLLSRITLAAVLAVASSMALAQVPYTVPAQCLPSSDPSSTTASLPYLSFNAKGVCVRWYCFPPGVTINKVIYCGTWAELSKVGARVQTIQKAADPLASLQNAGKRFPMVPLTDPSMSGMPTQ